MTLSLPVFRFLASSGGGVTPLSAPVVSGLNVPGTATALTATPGTYPGTPTITGQWQKNGVAIGGATGLTYTTATTDGPNVAYLETAAYSGGPTLTQRALSQYLGQVSTKGGRLPLTQNSTNKQINSRLHAKARQNITQLQLVYPVGWYWDKTTTLQEAIQTGTTTLTAAIEYPAGTIHKQVTFNSGATSSGALSANQNFSSDLMTGLNIPAGADYWVRTFCVCSTAIVFFGTTSANPAGAVEVLDTGNGECMEYAASGLSDRTLTGGTFTNTSASQSPGYGPILHLAPTVLSSVLAIGDSIDNGWGDQYGFASNTTGDKGIICKSIGPSLPYSNFGCPGDSFVNYIASHTRRLELAKYHSHIISNYGVNDVRQGGTGLGRTAAQVEADMQTVWSSTPTVPVYQLTITPVSSDSASNWQSPGTQTTNACNTNRVAINAYVRGAPANLTGYFDPATPLETSLGSGIWAASVPSLSVDGLHPSPTGYAAIQSAAVINPAVLTR